MPKSGSEKNSAFWLRLLKLNKFEKIELINLSKQSRSNSIFDDASPKTLYVAYGVCKRREVVFIPKHVTVIGHNAKMIVLDKELSLSTPKAVFIASTKSTTSKNDWTIVDIDGEKELSDSTVLKSGYYPLVFLHRANMVGCELQCSSITQGIVAKGSCTISCNDIFDSRKTGIFIHDSGSEKGVLIENNSLYHQDFSVAIGIMSYNCRKCVQNNNQILMEEESSDESDIEAPPN